jgi:hypothetical protein
MTSPAYPVFEGDGGTHAPKRPTAAVDLGGLDFVDSVKYPPKDRERLSATDYMQATMSLERLARVTPVMLVDALGDTTDTGTTAVASVNDALTTANVVTTRVDAGKYRVTYPSGKLPAANSAPVAQIIKAAGGIASVEVNAYTSTTVDVWAYDFAGSVSGNSVDFKVLVY